MPIFGDDDPEDAYDPSDPINERLSNLLLRLNWALDRLASGEVREHLLNLFDDLHLIREDLRQ